MKQTSIFAFLVFCTILSSCTQNKNTIPEIIETIKTPIVNDDLTVNLSNCKYTDKDIYIINSDYVIYQNCTERKYIHPFIPSFKIPKYYEGNEGGFFALDKDGVYFRGNFIKTDTSGFKIVGKNNDRNNPEILWKTKKRVYKNIKPIDVSDVSSFESIECFNGYYFKDKNYIYYFDKKIENSDGSSVIKSCDNFCYDKNYVYMDGKILKFEDEKVSPINDILFKTSKFVLTKELEKLNMDVATIKKLSKNHAMDKNNVYYKTEKTPIKPQNFKNVKAWYQVNSAYVSDGINVYSGTNGLEKDLDAKSFGMLPHSDFFYDKNGVYEREWNKKKEQVINKKFPFQYTDFVTSKNTFITDDSKYILYNNQAYDPWDKILYKNLSEKQIRLAKESKLSIEKIDSKTIPAETEFDYLLTKNNNTIYWDDKKTIADAESFEPLNYLYYKDKNRIYYYDRERGLITIKGIDLNTVKLAFTSVGRAFLTDKNYIYSFKTRLFKNKNIELLGVFTGYRKGCGLDKKPSSDYYLFKNSEAFWLVLISNNIIIRNLGVTLDSKWNENLKNFKIK